jgi:hypothetical protein
MTTASPFTQRFRGAPGVQALVLTIVAAMSFSACGGGDDVDGSDTAAGDASASAPSPSAGPTTGERDADAPAATPIRITFGDAELTGRLTDNATARDLAAQLPLMLTFRDHNNAEKTAPLARELSVDGAPEGHDPAAGEIGYWAPDGDLVLYYDADAPFFDGIVRIGEFDGGSDVLERQEGGFSITIERAE